MASRLSITEFARAIGGVAGDETVVVAAEDGGSDVAYVPRGFNQAFPAPPSTLLRRECMLLSEMYFVTNASAAADFAEEVLCVIEKVRSYLDVPTMSRLLDSFLDGQNALMCKANAVIKMCALWPGDTFVRMTQFISRYIQFPHERVPDIINSLDDRALAAVTRHLNGGPPMDVRIPNFSFQVKVLAADVPPVRDSLINDLHAHVFSDGTYRFETSEDGLRVLHAVAPHMSAHDLMCAMEPICRGAWPEAAILGMPVHVLAKLVKAPDGVMHHAALTDATFQACAKAALRYMHGADLASVICNDAICGMSLSTLQSPRVLNDGHAYEQSYVERWMDQSNMTPMNTHRRTIGPLRCVELEGIMDQVNERVASMARWKTTAGGDNDSAERERSLTQDVEFMWKTMTLPLREVVCLESPRAGRKRQLRSHAPC